MDVPSIRLPEVKDYLPDLPALPDFPVAPALPEPPDFAAALWARAAKVPDETLPPFCVAVALWMRAAALEVMLDFEDLLIALKFVRSGSFNQGED